MKFTYLYRTSDNVQHEDVIEAKSRDDAFAQLRVRGIRPVRVTAPPLPWWSKLSVRWVLIFALLTIVALLLLRKDRTSIGAAGYVDVPVVGSEAFPIGRKQIWGDRAIIEQAAKGNWRVIFPNPADRLLALFAQPGYMFAMPMIPPTIEDDFAVALKAPVMISESDLDEYRQMKRIVAGMKTELREYMSEGGTLKGYIARLVDRQKAESAVYEREREALTEAARGKPIEELIPLWTEANRRLRALGLKTLEMPYETQLKIR